MTNSNEATKKATDDKTQDSVGTTQNKIADINKKSSENKSSENASGSGDTLQKVAETAQGFVSDKAGQVGEYAHQAYDKAYEKANKLGSRATDAFNTSAEYVRNIDVEKARDSVKTAVKEKPELSIVIAALTGLVIGLVIGRKK